MNTSNHLNKGPSALPLYFDLLLQVLRLDSYGHFLGIIFNVKPWKWPSNLLRSYTLQPCLFFYIPVFRRKQELSLRWRGTELIPNNWTHKLFFRLNYLPRTGQIPPDLRQALENTLSSWIRRFLALNITCTSTKNKKHYLYKPNSIQSKRPTPEIDTTKES